MANRFSEWFFFSQSTPMGKGTRAARVAGVGRWKASQGIKEVKSGGLVIGTQQSFKYHNNNDAASTITTANDKEWLMQEYAILKDTKKHDWVIWKIYLKHKARNELALSGSSDVRTSIPSKRKRAEIDHGEEVDDDDVTFAPSVEAGERVVSGTGNASSFPPQASCSQELLCTRVVQNDYNIWPLPPQHYSGSSFSFEEVPLLDAVDIYLDPDKDGCHR